MASRTILHLIHKDHKKDQEKKFKTSLYQHFSFYD